MCEEEYACALCSQTVELNQCGSILICQFISIYIQFIDVVWSVVRSFDQPQTYKKFMQTCKRAT